MLAVVWYLLSLTSEDSVMVGQALVQVEVADRQDLTADTVASGADAALFIAGVCVDVGAY